MDCVLRAHNRSPVHPVKRYQERWVNFGLLYCLEEFALNVVEVNLLIIRDVSDVFEELRVLWRKHTWWKEFLWLNLVLIVHHFLKAFLICLVPPRKLSNPKVA
jgi:hypothetical protein